MKTYLWSELSRSKNVPGCVPLSTSLARSPLILPQYQHDSRRTDRAAKKGDRRLDNFNKKVCYLWRSISLWFFVRSFSPSADASSFFVRASWTGPKPTRVAVFSSPFSVGSCWSHHKSRYSQQPYNSPVSRTSGPGECWASGPCMGRSRPTGPDDCIFVKIFFFSIFFGNFFINTEQR